MPTIRPARFAVAFVLVFCFGWGALLAEVHAQCPAPEQIQANVKKLFQNAQITTITPAQINGLCQVQVKLGAQQRIVYVDAAGKYFLAGNLVEADTGKNLTMEAIQVINRIPPEEIRQLASLTGLTLGRGAKAVYLVTDPQCPYCDQAEAILKKMAENNEITLHFLFYPLASHKGAKEQCVAFLCDQKGIDDWEKGYTSDHQCPQGIKKVDDTMAWLQKRGIGATPTIIFADGLYHSGMMPEHLLRQRLNLPLAGGKAGIPETGKRQP